MAWDFLFLGIPGDDSAAFWGLVEFCAAHRETVLDAMPHFVATIAVHDGFETALRLVRSLSGNRVYVSADPTRFRARVGLAISDEAHAAISARLPVSLLVDVPSAWGVFLTLRRIAIREAIAGGADRHSVARRFGVSERSLRS